jgi:hypothetical protein
MELITTIEPAVTSPTIAVAAAFTYRLLAAAL